MFVKMKRAMVQAQTPAALNAIRYQQWMGTAVGGSSSHAHCQHVLADCSAIVSSQERRTDQYVSF